GLTRDHHLGSYLEEEPLGEVLGLELLQVVVERDDEHVRDTERLDQLQPAGERRQQLDAVAEDEARVPVEGDDRGNEPRLDRRLDDAPVAAVDAVEGTDRDRPPPPLELLGPADDPHGSTVPSTATSSPPHRTRTRSATRRRPCRIAAASRASTSTAGRKASASAGGTIRSSSACATEKGPTSVRRRLRQWPPSTSAIART